MGEVRLTILMVFSGALVITTLVSFYFAGTIARPLRRLAEAAEAVRHSVGRDSDAIPDLTKRRDEIGDLSGVLRDMTEALTNRMEAIERFAADVSHEIKNPLTSVKSAIETIQRIENPDHQRELLRIVKEDVERLDRLITDISDASRLDSELGRIDTQEIDLAKMLELLVSMHSITRGEEALTAPMDQATSPDSRLSLVVEESSSYRLNGVESRLVQVFRNLIGNAESFSPQDGKIILDLRREGGWIIVLCDDEGPGLPENKLDDIFDRFYSERPQHEKFGAHSGLGLSICKQIIEAHGGSIRAENRPARISMRSGARFVVHLPAL
jgi:two-component system sensor histidine kinase ChvG